MVPSDIGGFGTRVAPVFVEDVTVVVVATTATPATPAVAPATHTAPAATVEGAVGRRH